MRAARFEEVGHHERRVVVNARGNLESTARRRYGPRAQPGIPANIFELLEKENRGTILNRGERGNQAAGSGANDNDVHGHIF